MKEPFAGEQGNNIFKQTHEGLPKPCMLRIASTLSQQKTLRIFCLTQMHANITFVMGRSLRLFLRLLRPRSSEMVQGTIYKIIRSGTRLCDMELLPVLAPCQQGATPPQGSLQPSSCLLLCSARGRSRHQVRSASSPNRKRI